MAGFNISAHTFTFRELAAVTKNFRPECFIGEGGFGRVYKGRLDTGQVVAVKQLDKNGLQGNKEFLVEVLMLSLLHHPSLVSLIGYCADGDQRLLIYEFMPYGSLEDHLLDVVTAISYLVTQGYDPKAAPTSSNRSGADHEERNRRTGRDENGGSMLTKGDDAGGSGHRLEVNGMERDDSPKEVIRILNKDFNREKALVEAKLWGENWREKIRASQVNSKTDY